MVPGHQNAFAAVEQLISEQSGPTDPSHAYLVSHKQRYATLLGLLDGLGLAASSPVLELGCADGVLSTYLSRRYGFKVSGLDSASEAVERARARGLEAQVCDMDRSPLPFPPSSFRLVLCDSLLEHLYNPAFALNEVRRVVAADGYVVIGTPNATSLVQRLRHLAGENPFAMFNRFNAVEAHAFMRQCAVFYTPAEVTAALGGAFKVESVRYTQLFAKYRERRPFWRNAVTPVRLAICRLCPSLSEFFYVLARRVDEPCAS